MEDPKIGFLEFRERVAKVYSHYKNIGQDLHWLFPTRAMIGKLEKRTVELSIYRVPSKIRSLKEEAYSPRVVSIGPFHRNKHDLLAMEEYKFRYMLSLFKRTQNSRTCLDVCGEAILKLEARARGSYADTVNFDPHQLSEIMLVDGCFILELFLRESLNDEVDVADPIPNNAWMKPTLRYDLALLENQIPFFILQLLFDTVVERMTTKLPLSMSITELALSFFLPELKDLGQEVTKEKYNNGIAHLLDLLHIFYLPISPRMNPSKEGNETLGFKNCATNLSEAGIDFEPGSYRLLDIDFNEGMIKIPTLCIEETTNSLLRNLIAFEQCRLGSAHYVTSYAVLMKSLIHSSLDVELLEGKGIIKKDLGAVEDALSLFSSILNEVVLKDFYFGKVCEDVNEYHQPCWHWQRLKTSWKVRWPRYRAAWKREIFPNPWRIIAFFAAVFLLILTAVQTGYTVGGYYPH